MILHGSSDDRLTNKLIGFDEDIYESGSKATNYPPYNIEQIAGSILKLSLATAGFSPNDLSVTLEGNQLIISGITKQDHQDRIFIYKGIANRQFRKVFAVSDNIEIIEANYNNGILSIYMQKRNNASKIIKIAITSDKAHKEYVKTTTQKGIRLDPEDYLIPKTTKDPTLDN